MSGVGDAMAVAASTKTLFRRGVANRISGAATHIGRMITILSWDRDRALDNLSYEVSEELRALNCTLPAIALSDYNEGARLYLERVMEAGIASHDDLIYRMSHLAELERALKEA